MVSLAAKSLPKLRGVVFSQFTKRKELVKRHWLDTRIDQYYDVVNRIVIPECKNVTPDLPGYMERIDKLLNYTNPGIHDSWNFPAELVYRTVADANHQTEENITKMYIIRASVDMLCTMFVLLDDIVDKSEVRNGKRSWHTFCEGGELAAIFDGIQIGVFSFHLIKKHFRNDPGYTLLMETIAKVLMKMNIGQTIDLLGQYNKSPLMKDYELINSYKAAQFFGTGSVLGAIHAGILSQELLDKTLEIFSIGAQISQTWDDFNDYYCSAEQIGKPSCDRTNAGTTWVSAKAMEVFTPSQRAEFVKCYGSDDEEKQKRVQELYDEIDMSKLYIEHITEVYKYCQTLIKRLPHEKLREACFSYLEWMVVRDDPSID